jgi:two-component system sensor histidine kinase AtoS
MQVGALIVDSTGVVIWADPRSTSLLGLSNEECLNRSLAELLHLSAENGQRLSEFLAERAEVLTLQEATEDDVVIVARLQSLVGDRSETPGAITQYRCQLSIRDDALFERTALAAVQLRSTIQSIIAGFAHEVRNPLAAILSIVEASIQENSMPPGTSAGLMRIPALIERIESLIRQAHDYSKPALPKKAPIAPIALVDGAIEMLQRKYSRIKICKEIDDTLPQVLVDFGQIERTLINLLDNACFAARGQVTVAARRARLHSGVVVVVEVRDDGPGIADTIQQRIFEPFFTTKAKGTGLGLALARDLARINGGDLRLRASSPEGTAFRLMLPTRQKAPRAKSAS